MKRKRWKKERECEGKTGGEQRKENTAEEVRGALQVSAAQRIHSKHLNTEFQARGQQKKILLGAVVSSSPPTK